MRLLAVAVFLMWLVSLPLAAAPDPVVPDVMGRSREQAAAALAKAGFAWSIADAADAFGPGIDDLELCFNGSHVGTVCSQDPAAGARADKGSEIHALVGDAATVPVIAMPDLTGLTLDQAKAAVKKAGFAHELGSTFDDKCKHGIVCGQKFPAGMKVRKSSYQVVDFGP
jgi:serine/threonine-protein kinase